MVLRLCLACWGPADQRQGQHRGCPPSSPPPRSSAGPSPSPSASPPGGWRGPPFRSPFRASFSKRPAVPRHLRTHFAALNLPTTATSADVRNAYRQLALRLHPDRHMSGTMPKEQAEAEFRRVAEAYKALSEFLKEPSRRIPMYA